MSEEKTNSTPANDPEGVDQTPEERLSDKFAEQADAVTSGLRDLLPDSKPTGYEEVRPVKGTTETAALPGAAEMSAEAAVPVETVGRGGRSGGNTRRFSQGRTGSRGRGRAHGGCLRHPGRARAGGAVRSRGDGGRVEQRRSSHVGAGLADAGDPATADRVGHPTAFDHHQGSSLPAPSRRHVAAVLRRSHRLRGVGR